jgi:hypothetical protein
MSRITFEPKVNLGHVIIFIGWLVTIVIGWTTLNGRVEGLEKSDAVQERRIESLQQFDVDVGKQLTEMGVDIRYLRAWAEEERRSERAAEVRE